MDTLYSIPNPPEDLKFRKMIIQVGRELDKQPDVLTELVAKHKCPVACSGIQFLTWMMSTGDLSGDNMHILRDILLLLNREDLLLLAVELCRNDNNKISFAHDEKVSIPEGCIAVKLFINTTSLDRSMIEDIRSRLSHALLIPSNHVKVLAKEREPYSVTFSVPVLYRELVGDVHLVSHLRATCIIGIELQDGHVITMPASENTIMIRGELTSPQYMTEISHQHANDIAELTKEVADLTQALEDACEENVKLHCKLETTLNKQKALVKLHESSGMSTTLWKITGQLDDGNDRPMYPPKKSQDEIMREAMHAKIRRVYPQIEYTPARHNETGTLNHQS